MVAVTTDIRRLRARIAVHQQCMHWDSKRNNCYTTRFGGCKCLIEASRRLQTSKDLKQPRNYPKEE